MESLNSYISDGESDSSTTMENFPYQDRRKSHSSQEEADANCEPITMDMSEDSGDSHSNGGKNKSEAPKRYYSRSLSPSPPTSFSSDSSPDRKKKKSDDERRASPDRSRESMKNRRYDDDRRKSDRDYKRDDRDRKYARDRSKERYSRDKDKDSDRYQSSRGRYEGKRSHRSRSRSYSRHSSSKRKNKSRSRSRSHDRHHRHSPRRSSKRRSPYRSRRSRTPTPPKDKARPYDWKSSSKMKVLEKLGIEIKVPPGGIDISQSGIVSAPSNSQLTPQLLLQKTMEEQVEKVRTATGIELPSYYNPIAVNPTKYAEQIQKRRLLWGNKDKQVKPVERPVAKPVAEPKGSGTIWQGATFGGDQDGKMTAKFKRLMGIKNAEKESAADVAKLTGSDLIKKQEEMFHSMESQYEVARLATHSHRGLGLGFGTFQPR